MWPSQELSVLPCQLPPLTGPGVSGVSHQIVAIVYWHHVEPGLTERKSSQHESDPRMRLLLACCAAGALSDPPVLRVTNGMPAGGMFGSGRQLLQVQALMYS
jgi:hypothetical protein